MFAEEDGGNDGDAEEDVAEGEEDGARIELQRERKLRPIIAIPQQRIR